MFKRIADLNVHYEVQGEGAPLVLLHGGGSRAQTFEEMVPILAKAWRVYTFDMRGFGDTERPPEPKLSYDVGKPTCCGSSTPSASSRSCWGAGHWAARSP